MSQQINKTGKVAVALGLAVAASAGAVLALAVGGVLGGVVGTLGGLVAGWTVADSFFRLAQRRAW